MQFNAVYYLRYLMFVVGDGKSICWHISFAGAVPENTPVGKICRTKSNLENLKIYCIYKEKIVLDVPVYRACK